MHICHCRLIIISNASNDEQKLNDDETKNPKKNTFQLSRKKRKKPNDDNKNNGIDKIKGASTVRLKKEIIHKNTPYIRKSNGNTNIDAIGNNHNQSSNNKKQQYELQNALNKEMLDDMEEFSTSAAEQVFAPNNTNTTYGHGQNGNNNNNSSQQSNNNNNNGNNSNNGGYHSNYSGYGYGYGYGSGGGGGIGSGGGSGGGGKRPNGNNNNKHNHDPSYNPYYNDMLEDEDEDKQKEHSHSHSHSRSSLDRNAPSYNPYGLPGIKEEQQRKYKNTLNGTRITCDEEMGYKVLNDLMNELTNALDNESIGTIEKKLFTAVSVVGSIKNNNGDDSNPNRSHSNLITKRKLHTHTPSNGTNHSPSNNGKKKRKRKASDFLLSYEPIPKYAARQNFKIVHKFTEEKMPQIIHENIDNCYEYVLKTIAMQQYDKNIFNNGEICIVNLDLHSKTNSTESLYLVSTTIVDNDKKRHYRWNTESKLYIQTEIDKKNISKDNLPKSSRQNEGFMNVHNVKHKIQDSLTKIIENDNNDQKLCTQFFKQKWNKLPVFNKLNKSNKPENKLRITISITKEEFEKKLRYFIQEKKNNDKQLNLIPIIMFNNTRQDRERYEIHYIHIIRILDDERNIKTDIGISYQYLTKQDRIIATGIHLDRNMLYKQHQLVDPKHMTDCKCFDGFSSNITHFHCGNCDEAENKIKILTKTIDEHKQEINTLKSIIKTVNKDDEYGQVDYEMTPSISSSGIYSVSMTMAETPSNSVRNNMIYPPPSYSIANNKSNDNPANGNRKTSSNSNILNLNLEDKSSE